MSRGAQNSVSASFRKIRWSATAEYPLIHVYAHIFVPKTAKIENFSHKMFLS